MTNLLRRFFFQNKSSFEVIQSPDLSRLNSRLLFIGLGAMKSGTSWVSDFLRGHPKVYHSEVKEMNFWNTLDENVFRGAGSEFRILRMKQMLLERNSKYLPDLKKWEKLQTLAELDNLNTTKDYESYFARRIGSETHFGEICPQYSLIPPETYVRISELGYETRFMLFMRDPTERLASNIQHVLRRNKYNVDQLIDNLTEDSLMYQRSDYSLTLSAYRNSGVNIPLKTFVYEDLFNDEAIHSICKFLGIDYMQANFDKRVNAARGVEITSDQKQRIREKLDPLYVKLSGYLDEKPTSWRW
jgi:hypothetical protein